MGSEYDYGKWLAREDALYFDEPPEVQRFIDKRNIHSRLENEKVHFRPGGGLRKSDDLALLKFHRLAMSNKISLAREALGMPPRWGIPAHRQESGQRSRNEPSPDRGRPSPPFDTRPPDRVPEAQEPTPLTATRFALTDPASIPPRRFLYARDFIRGFVTVTVAPGGVGKSSLATVEALCMCSGLPLLGKAVEGPLRVWSINLEDPQDELQRRYQAAAMRYGMGTENIEDRLYVDSGRVQSLVIAQQADRGKTMIVRPVVDRLIAELKSKEIDVLIVDPFVSSHGVSENDNMGMDKVVKQWCAIAEETNCAVHLVHHSRKLGADLEVTTESARGGKALTDGARVVRAVNRMTPEEAKELGLKNHRSFFRVFNDKANMAPPPDISDWYQLENYELANGDHVGVVTSWEPPNAFEDVTPTDLLNVQRKISLGEYREDQRAASWAGKIVAEVLGLDPENDKPRIRRILKKWVETGALKVEISEDEHRKKKTFYRVGEWATND